MKTKSTRTVVRTADIQSDADLKAIEVFGMIEGNEAKITARYWSLMFDPFYQVWRKNGIKPLTRDEVLERCGR